MSTEMARLSNCGKERICLMMGRMRNVSSSGDTGFEAGDVDCPPISRMVVEGG